MTRPVVSLVAFSLFLAAFGCGSSEPTTPSGPPAGMGSKSGPPSGNKVFDTHCLGCHTTTTQVGIPQKGPNLSKVGATRKADWLADHVKNPKTHKQESTMPEFASKLSADELKSVTDFMAELK